MSLEEETVSFMLVSWNDQHEADLVVIDFPVSVQKFQASNRLLRPGKLMKGFGLQFG